MSETIAEQRLRDHITRLYADANEPGISDARAEARAHMADACDIGREAIAAWARFADIADHDIFCRVCERQLSAATHQDWCMVPAVRALLTRAGKGEGDAR
jgi:hypothetical protein